MRIYYTRMVSLTNNPPPAPAVPDHGQTLKGSTMIQHTRECNPCNGSGGIHGVPCKECHGIGVFPSRSGGNTCETCEGEGTTLTVEQHAAADAAIVANMGNRIIGSEWGREIIVAVADECAAGGEAFATPTLQADGFYRLQALNPEDNDNVDRYTFTPYIIATTIAAIWNGQHEISREIRNDITDAIRDHDAAMIDADAADAILQIALYGTITYG